MPSPLAVPDRPTRRIRRAGRRPRWVLALGLSAAAWWAPAHLAAAPNTHADPAGVCAGRTPCFTTLQQAVDQAGPAPATVLVFPGTYAESVDLLTMGSAVGAGVGDLVLQAVDPAGAPAVGLAAIDPGASGGPGTGSALSAVGPMSTPLAMDLAVFGLVLTSPDQGGLIAAIDGRVELADLEAAASPGTGLGAQATGPVVASDLVALGNGGFGVVLGSSASVRAERVTADGNGGGMVLFAGGTLEGIDLQANANTTGLGVAGCGDLQLRAVVARDNQDRGLEVETRPATAPECQQLVTAAPAPGAAWPWPRTGRAAAPFDGFAAVRERARAAGAEGLLGSVAVVLEQVEAVANGGDGVFGVIEFGALAISGLTAPHTGGAGAALLVASEMTVADSVFDANASGLVAVAEALAISTSRAEGSVGGNPGQAGDGYGFFLGAASMQLVGLEARGHLGPGLGVGGTVPGGLATVDLEGGAFELNPIGLERLEASGAEPLAWTVAATALVGNGTGLRIRGGEDRLTVRRARIEGNDLGLEADVAGALRISEVDFQGNGVAAAATLPAGVRGTVVCSNFLGSTTGRGLELLGPGEIAAADNFWDAASGPTHPDNPAGSGEAILDAASGGAGSVDFQPFLPAPATGGSCGASVLEVPVERPALLAFALLLTLGALARLRFG